MSDSLKESVAYKDCILTNDVVQLYSSSPINNSHEALTVLLHAFMLESGFVPKDVAEKDKYKYMPAGWNAKEVFKILYSHHSCPKFICCMTCVPLYKTLSVHGIICDIDCIDSINVKVHEVKYLKKRKDFSNACNSFFHLDELSRCFKDNFCLPLLNLLHETAGCIPPYGLHGLMDELKVYILQLLPVKSVVSMSAVNKNFNKLTNSSYLWKHLFERDFCKDGVPDISSTSSNTNWKQVYVTEYKKRNKRQMARHYIFHPYQLPQILPVGPDCDTDLGIYFDPPFPGIFQSQHNIFPMLPPRPSFFQK